MDTCKNCVYRVFDDRWGEYRCEIYDHAVKDVYKYIDCESHERKEKGDKNDSRRS